MAPEQARGEAVDFRADVFALGSMLATILTGRPAFVGATAVETVWKAANAELSDALTRLDKCGADTELVALAKRCLSADVADRPADGKVVAAEVGAYRSGVEGRLRQAESERAAAVVRAAETRKRQRVIVWASGIAVGILLAGVVGVALAMMEAMRQKWVAKGETAAKDVALQAEKEARRDETYARMAEQEATAELWAGLDVMTADVTGDTLGSQQAVSGEQRAFLGNVLPLYRKLAARRGNDEPTRARVAYAAFRVGLIEYRLGRTEEAVAALSQARDEYTRLAADFPSAPEYRKELAGSHNNLGLLLADLGRRADAEGQYREGLALREQLAADFPAVPEYRKNLSASHNNLGNLLRELGRRADAEGHYRKGLALREQLAADFPAVPEYRSLLATSHNNLGNLRSDLGQRADAEGHYRNGLALRQQLVAEFPAAPDHRNDLAVSHTVLGTLLSDLGQRVEAEGHYRKGLALREKLAADFPAVPRYRSYLAEGHTLLGNLLKELGKWTDAEGQYRKGLAVREQLAAEFPAVPEYRSHLATSHNNLGLLLADLGQRADAEVQYRKGLAVREQLAADFPTVPEYRSHQATSHNNLGLLLAGTGKRADAEGHYRKGLVIQEKLVADFPDVPEHRKDLAASHNNLGLLLAGTGKRADAEGHYRNAVAIFERLAADFPAAPDYKVSLGGSYANLGNLQRDGGQPADGLDWFGKAIETLRPVHEAEPRDVTAKLFLRNCHWGRAVTYDRLQEPAEAVKEWDRAIDLSPKEVHLVLRSYRATSQVNAGQVSEAVAAVADMLKIPGTPPEFLYRYAVVYAVASAKVAEERQKYADRAMELLNKAVKGGFKDAANLKSEKQLDPLRERDDFKKLLAEFEAKAPPEK